MIRALARITVLLSPLSVAAQGDEVFAFGDDDTAMQQAIETAQSTLPLFLSRVVDAEGYGADGTLVKVRFPVDSAQMDTEIIWVGPFLQLDDANFVGLLANAPNAMGNLRRGDQVQFDIAMIVDWSWNGPDGKGYGNYTTRAMIPALNADQAAQMRDYLSVVPIPQGWQ